MLFYSFIPYVNDLVFINILPTSMLKKLNKQEHDLIPTKVTMNNFVRRVTKTKGILPIEIMIGNKSIVVESKSNYNALLNRDQIHATFYVLSSPYQTILFYNSEEVEVVRVEKPTLPSRQ